MSAPRIPDGRKMLIYERFFSPLMDYTITEAYDFIERHAPVDFRVCGTIETFQRKVLEAFPVDGAIAARLLARNAGAPHAKLGVQLAAELREMLGEALRDAPKDAPPGWNRRAEPH